MFENKQVNGIYYTRYIVSWVKAGGRITVRGERFKDWLKTVGLDDDQIRDIWEIATNGKLELEENAKKYLKDNYLI